LLSCIVTASGKRFFCLQDKKACKKQLAALTGDQIEERVELLKLLSVSDRERAGYL
jgi:hypothetical protein